MVLLKGLKLEGMAGDFRRQRASADGWFLAQAWRRCRDSGGLKMHNCFDWKKECEGRGCNLALLESSNAGGGRRWQPGMCMEGLLKFKRQQVDL